MNAGNLWLPSIEVEIPVGVRLHNFLETWATLIPRPWVVQIISQRLLNKVSVYSPIQGGTDASLLPPKKQTLLEACIILFLSDEGTGGGTHGAKKGVYFPVFLVPKPSGDWRIIIDLQFLNLYIRKTRFRMETFCSVAAILEPGHYMAPLDLKEAYLHITIYKPHRKFLRVAEYLKGSGSYLQLTTLPFGITSAPKWCPQ